MKLERCRVAVTGAAGFIGSHLADRLLQLGFEVIAIDNLDPYYEGKEENIQHNLGNPNYHFLKLDILDLENLSVALKGVDVVFHLAAQPGVRYSMDNPIKTNSVNTTGTLNVLISARKQGVKKVVFASSSSVYGIPQYMPVDENHPTNPISVYGASKLAAEKYCKVFNELTKLPIVILRYHTVYGPRQRPDMAIHKWVKQLFEGKAPTIYGSGEQTRDFTYVDDIVNGTLKAAENQSVTSDIFNLGGGSRVSILHVVSLLIKLTGKRDVSPIYEASKLGDVPDTCANITKARKLLGYEPKVSLEEGLKRFIAWYRSKT